MLVITAASAHATPVMDGNVGVGEYAHSRFVGASSDLGGAYDPGTSGSFAGGAVNCHDDWSLYWDYDATYFYLAAEPKAGTGSSCSDDSLGFQFVAGTGDPNVALTGCEQCTGSPLSINLNSSTAAAECAANGGLTGIGSTEADAPGAGAWEYFQGVVGTEIRPIEMRVARSDLTYFGDTTTYASGGSEDFPCTYVRVSAFDSRGVFNATGPGARTIWLRVNPGGAACPVGGSPPTCGDVCGDGTWGVTEDCDGSDVSSPAGCGVDCTLSCGSEDNLLSSGDGGTAPISTDVWSDENSLPSAAAGAFDGDEGTFWNSDWSGPSFEPVEGYGDHSYLWADLPSVQKINQISVVNDSTPSECLDFYVTTSGSAAKDTLANWNLFDSGTALGTGRYVFTVVGGMDASEVKAVFPTCNVADARILEFEARFCDADDDGAGDFSDNCVNDANPGQEDFDSDGVGDVCDPCLSDAANDGDGDGVCAGVGFNNVFAPFPTDDEDNCPVDFNPGQGDANNDGVGNVCDDPLTGLSLKKLLVRTNLTRDDRDRIVANGELDVFSTGEDVLTSIPADGVSVELFDLNDVSVNSFTWTGADCALTPVRGAKKSGIFCWDIATRSSLRLRKRISPGFFGVVVKVKRQNLPTHPTVAEIPVSLVLTTPDPSEVAPNLFIAHKVVVLGCATEQGKLKCRP
ncbi:MAG: thrombospondin type 3 repeat-containing protein [bacterium]